MASFIRVLVDQCKTSEVCHAHIVEMVRIAHKAFEHDRGAAVVLYKLICALGIRDYLSELRVVESQLDAERLADATITMQELMELHTLDSWGLLVLSRVQFAEGNYRLASETIATVVNADESGSFVKSTAIHTLLSFGLLENADNSYKELLKKSEYQDRDFRNETYGIEFRLNLLRHNHERLLRDCRTPGFLERIPNWVCVEGLYHFNQFEAPEYSIRPHGCA